MKSYVIVCYSYEKLCYALLGLLYCVVLRYIMLCCVVLCCICCAVLWYDVSCYVCCVI